MHRPFQARAAGEILAAPALLCAVVALGFAAERPAGLPDATVSVTSADGRTLEVLRALRVPVGRGAEGAERTRAWLESGAESFGLSPGTDAVALTRVEAVAHGRTRVTLAQTWRGIPVTGAGARGVISDAGELLALFSTLRPVAPDAEEPRWTPERARAIAADAAGLLLTREMAHTRLVVHRAGESDQLAWEVAFEPAERGPLRVWVAASDGRVLEVDPGIANAVGWAYLTDPRGSIAEVTLERLLPASGLASHLVAIEDQAGPKVTPLAPGDYRYPPEDPRFDQVNAYWHSDRFLHGYLGGLGYAGPPESLIVRVHSPLEPNVALTSGRFVHMGRAIPGFTYDASRSHDLLYHELVHAVLYGKDVQPGGNARQANALHEGLADYFSAAYTGDPALGEWAYLQFPLGATRVDMPADPWNMARYDQLTFGGAPPSSSWANGMILSSALWDLRGEIGAAADSLVLESMDYLPPVPTWSHFSNALLQADADLHGSRFESRITATLLRRGIRGAAVAEFSGPTQLTPGQVGVFRAAPCCGGVFGRYTWSARSVCRGELCGEPRVLGEGLTLEVAFRDEADLTLRVETPWGDTLTRTRRVALRSPTLEVDGPTRVPQHGRGVWTARGVASAPSTIQWERWWAGPGTPYRFLGTGAEMSFDMDTSCVIKVTLRDGQGRAVYKQLEVQTYRDSPPPIISGVFKVSLAMEPGARRGEVRYELIRSARLQMEILDVTGRLRLRLADAPESRGARVLRFDAGALEPGFYLLRVRHGEDGTALRFVLAR